MTTKLEEMLQGLSQLSGMPPAPLVESTAAQPMRLVEPEPLQMSEAQVFARFRQDMRLAGLASYDTIHEMCGQPHDGPAVNVRDPKQALNATSLTLVSLALAPGLWRMYPVCTPVEV